VDLGIVIVAVIVIPVGPFVEILPVGDDHAALAGGDGLVVVEAEDAHIPESAELFPP